MNGAKHLAAGPSPGHVAEQAGSMCDDVEVLKRVCVFCGSSDGARPAYRAAAERLGEAIAASRVALVYGGSNIGLMQAVADAVLGAAGQAIGVIPEHLVAREIAHPGLTELHVVRTMHERKALMADLADAFVVLPGGLGTLEEFLEVITWSQLGLHAKPAGLLNVAGYWDALLHLLDHGVREGFVRPGQRERLLVDDDPARLLARIAGGLL